MKKVLIALFAAIVAAVPITFTGCGEDASSIPEWAVTDDAAKNTVSVVSPAKITTTAPASTAAATAPKTTAAAMTVPATTKATSGSSSQTSSRTDVIIRYGSSTGGSSRTAGESSAVSSQIPTSSAESSQPATEKGGSFEASDAVFTYYGISVPLNSDADDALSEFGEPESVHVDGEKKTYTYDGFTIKTYPLDGEDRVAEIVVSDTTFTTHKGIHFDSSAEDVVAAYGSDHGTLGSYYTYTTDDKESLLFLIEDGVVTGIQYAYTIS